MERGVVKREGERGIDDRQHEGEPAGVDAGLEDDPVAIAVDDGPPRVEEAGGSLGDVGEDDLGLRPIAGVLGHPDFVPAPPGLPDIGPRLERRAPGEEIGPGAGVRFEVDRRAAALMDRMGVEDAPGAGRPVAGPPAVGVAMGEDRAEEFGFRALGGGQVVPVVADEDPVGGRLDPHADPADVGEGARPMRSTVASQPRCSGVARDQGPSARADRATTPRSMRNGPPGVSTRPEAPARRASSTERAGRGGAPSASRARWL